MNVSYLFGEFQFDIRDHPISNPSLQSQVQMLYELPYYLREKMNQMEKNSIANL
jgi:hypothetical protein